VEEENKMIPLKDTIPHRKVPFVTVSLIIINFLVFFLELRQGVYIKDFLFKFGFVPAKLFLNYSLTKKVVPLFSNMFLRGSWFHLLGNNLYLWIFADNVEDRLGHVNFLLFYILCGLGANFFHFLMNINSTIPAIGASGAIAGVLGAYFLMFPRSRVVTLIPWFLFWEIVELPAFFFLGFWFIYQLLLALFSTGFASGVAFWAHIGGFLAGMFLLRFFLPKFKGGFRWI